MRFLMRYRIAPFLAGLLSVFSCAARADTLGQFDFHSPSGLIPPSPYVTAMGSGNFSFATSLISHLVDGSATTIHESNLNDFQFSVTANYQGSQSIFVFTLPTVISFAEVVSRNGPGFYGEGFSISTTAVSGSNPAFGSAILSGLSDSPGALLLTLNGGTLLGTNVSRGAAFNRNVLLTSETPEPSTLPTLGALSFAGSIWLAWRRKKQRLSTAA